MDLIIPYSLIALLCTFVAVFIPNGPDNYFKNYSRVRRYHIYFVIICLLIILFSGFRHIIAPAIDESVYRRRFDWYIGKDIIPIIKESDSPLFAILTWGGVNILHSNQGGILIATVFTVVLLIASLKRDAKDFSFAVILLFATGCIFDTFNGIAQYLAAAVFAYSFKYIYIKYIICVIICTLIHRASVIMLSFYILANTRACSVKMMIFDLLFAITMIIGYKQLYYLISRFGLLEDYIGVAINGHHGVNYLTIAIGIVPALICIYIKECVREYDYITNATINMVFIHSIIMLVSSMDVYIARLSIFTGYFVVLFYSRLSFYFKERSGILYPLIVLMYFLVLFLRIGGKFFYYFTI